MMTTTISRSSIFCMACLALSASQSCAFQLFPARSSSMSPLTQMHMSDKFNYEDDIFESHTSPAEARSLLSEEEFEAYVPQINSVTLVGRVGQNPEPRYFDDGKVVLRLSLACKRKYHPLERRALDIKYGEEETDWFNLELWGRDAEYAGKYVTKGARIGISGTLNMDAWVDRMTQEDRCSPKIIVQELDILETRAEAELRHSRSGGYNSNYGGGNNYGGGGYNSGDGPSSGGSGGFFDD